MPLPSSAWKEPTVVKFASPEEASQKKATRAAFGATLAELAAEGLPVVAVDADLSGSTTTKKFASAAPENEDRLFNVGIAEQNGAALSAGLATTGKIPFVVTYAVFGSLRMCEMIRQEMCYTNLNVKIACSHGGVTPANDGTSHQAIEDMGVLRTIPNITVIQPADYVSARKLVRAAAETYGPMYLRFTRDAVPVIYDEDQEFTIGKAVRLRDGKDVAIIAIGDTVRLALDAARELESKGISARVLDMHTLKPLDNEAVDACINDIGKIITVEDHNIINGLGSAVCERAAEAGKGKVVRIGIQDCFGQSAPYERLLAVNGITVENIVEKAMKGI